jgi:hypothetical protein|tara:strand:- start:1804 stop:2061 length:258 start_codon:yes stop_codon:yes gene_type:complete
MKCIDCNKKPGTHLHPFLLCDDCWSERFSTQYINGKDVPFKELFRDNLMKRGLWKEGEEMNDDVKSRCEIEGKKSKWLHGNTASE